MRDPNQYTFDFEGQGKELTTAEQDAGVKANLLRCGALNWLWLRANKHWRHAEILPPDTNTLRALMRELTQNPTNFANIYADDLRAVLAQRAIEEAKHLDARTAWKTDAPQN